MAPAAGLMQRIRIAARVRPGLPGEIDDGGIEAWQAANISSTDEEPFISIPTPSSSSTAASVNTTARWKFRFNSAWGPETRQADVFVRDVAPLVGVALNGMTATILAYGVTSSGKTHTMQGGEGELRGVIPRVVETLFEDKPEGARVQLSYMEIYKDEVYDLLDEGANSKGKAFKLPVREDGNGVVFVAGLRRVPLEDVSHFEDMYSQATLQRSVGATNLNRASSRSHAILTLEVEGPGIGEDPEGGLGKIVLVDLAGSENNKLTGNDASRLAESAAINKSLSVLGQVVRDLNAGKHRIPYRNSKLTRILQDALGGRSAGLLICNVAPGLKWRKDTLNTLNFATAVKDVENRVAVNERRVEDDEPPKRKGRASLIPAARPSIGGGRPSVGGGGAGTARGKRRTSTVGPGVLAEVAGGVAKKPRTSVVAPGPYAIRGKGGSGRQSVGGAGSGRQSVGGNRKSIVGPWRHHEDHGEDIDARIAKAVEAEVERRMREKAAEPVVEETKEDLASRLRALEQKFAQGDSSTNTPDVSFNTTAKNVSFGAASSPLVSTKPPFDADASFQAAGGPSTPSRTAPATPGNEMTPTMRKKTGRAYVALARKAAGTGDLQTALDLYRRAEAYVKGNVKLRERILDVEYALEHGRPIVGSPAKVKKIKVRVLSEKENGVSAVEEQGVKQVSEEPGVKEAEESVDVVMGE
ncbi:kinesin-domain-containing protein [Cylindrobasidium torrendii FP15055 ss-10]|uniref:Kinesin-like protein n=1 Tax=Cylindrobasidium torrendii FP15055 ss-10 TaxID=1314674 RepID=A0A0D7BGQ0_9AGAR|nr:kinesin-domain-containing protein [Cylindrobasidium torrendii FP15055 ss-10]